MRNKLLGLVAAGSIALGSAAVANERVQTGDRIWEVLWTDGVTSIYFAGGLPNGITEWDGVICNAQHMFDRTTAEPMELWIPQEISARNTRPNGETYEVIWICEDSWKTDI